jgi:sugar O-acyltransferase (sialic acid O-acetyltransferase NeuD family)
MFKRRIVVIGTGGHARSCVDVIEATKKFSIVGIVSKEVSHNGYWSRFPYLGADECLTEVVNKVENAFIGIGQIKSSTLRTDLYFKLKEIGFKIPKVISHDALVSPSSSIGEGTIVMNGAKIGGGVIIGENSIINTGAIIEHGAQVGSNCHVSTGAILNGEVVVGDGTFIGSNSAVREGITIGDFAIVGMGSNLRKDLPSRETFIGY